MSREPENLVLRALRDIRADVAETKSELKSSLSPKCVRCGPTLLLMS